MTACILRTYFGRWGVSDGADGHEGGHARIVGGRQRRAQLRRVRVPMRGVLCVHVGRHLQLLAAHRVRLDDAGIVQAAMHASGAVMGGALQQARVDSRRLRWAARAGADLQRAVGQGLHHLGIRPRLLPAGWQVVNYFSLGG